MSKKRKKKTVYPCCPCCGEPKHRTEVKTIVSAKERLEKALYKEAYKEFEFDSYNSFLDSDFEWACDSCLHSGRAVLANPSLQNYCWDPYLAYFDTVFSCSSCQKEFTFSKEEKRFWFEELKFWIESSPIKCVDCRKEFRLLKNQNKVLTDILKKNEDSLQPTEIDKVITVYNAWGKTEKVKYYKTLLRKKMRKAQ